MSTWRDERLAGEAGFTLIEVLLATLLMTVILGALATVTAQWLPNWNRGMARVQRAERLAMGLDRIVADLSVAEMIPVNSDARTPLFEGIRTGGDLRADGGRSQYAARARNRQARRKGRQSGPCVGARARTVHADADGCADPFRRSGCADPFAFSRDVFLCRTRQVWQPDWRGQTQLPDMVRVTVRDSVTGRGACSLTGRHGPRQCAGGLRAGQESGGLYAGGDAGCRQGEAECRQERGAALKCCTGWHETGY